MIPASVPRRFRRYVPYALWIALLSALPIGVLLLFSYHRTMTHAEAVLEGTVVRAHREVDTLLRQGQKNLREMKDVLDEDESVLRETLIRIVYESPYFREAGVIDETGRLVVTNLGPLDPPRDIPATHRSDRSDPGVQLVGPLETMVMHRRSMILIQPTPNGLEVNLLFDPSLLLYFVDPFEEASLGPDGYVAFVKPDGSVIALDGVAPPDNRIIDGERPGWMRISRTTSLGEITVVGEISKSWVLRTWEEVAIVSGPVAFLGVLSLVTSFVLFFRQTETLDNEIRTALENDEFELHYQPIVHAETGECIGSEALIRWRHPEQGMLLPALFIPAAEKTGLISEIGNWVVRRAVEEQRPLLDRFPGCYLSINLSPVQLNAGAVEGLIETLNAAPIARERIVFEITETTVLRQLDTTATDSLERIRGLGCKVALDDFGTGYSSLSYVHQLKLDYLKLDQQFVRGIDTDVRTNPILEAMIQLGRALDVNVVAEGVETEAQSAFLRERGVVFIQGWLYSRPLPLAEYQAFLEAHS